MFRSRRNAAQLSKNKGIIMSPLEDISCALPDDNPNPEHGAQEKEMESRSFG